jgi:hypothetical protein
VGLGVLRLRVLVGGGFGGGCHGWGLGGAGGERRFFVFSKTCAPVAVANKPNALPLKDGLFGLWRAGFALTNASPDGPLKIRKRTFVCPILVYTR